MTEFIQRKPLIFLFILVMVNVLLLSVQLRSGEGRVLLRSWVLWMVTPVASTLHFATSKIEDTVERYAILKDSNVENRRLRAQNSRLQIELVQLRSLQSTFSRRQDYQRAREEYLFDTLLAGIIWKSAPFHSRRFLLNVGTRDGVKRDTAVITPTGLVGRVWVVSPFSAEVELITNAGAGAGAMLIDSRLQGVIQGDGSTLLHWNFIPNFEEVKVGDIVYTSGTDRIYPKGLPIGRVVESKKSKLIYRQILVRPLVDYSRLEESLVVMPTSDG